MAETPGNEPRRRLLERIEDVLDRRVRADLSDDGGGVELVGIDDDDIVQVRLLGSCQGCSSATIATTMAIEKTLKAEIPEIRFVEPVL